FPPELAGRTRVGGLFDPNVERIVALRPDLVVLRGRNEPVERLCRDRHIRVYHDRTETLADVATCIVDLGRVLDRERAAEDLVRRFHARIGAIRERTAGRRRPRVFVTLNRNPQQLGHLLTAGKGTFITEMIEIAGGVNVFGEVEMAYPQVSAEAIVAKRPDVIMELMPEVAAGDAPAVRRVVLEQWSESSTLPAVRNERIHIMFDANALIPSPRYVEVIDKVSRVLHPEPGGDR
ncbi:MAG: ABC transporter substrate-binding protein, partial [Phycisphaerae bacterium]